MLLKLKIENIVLIQSAELQFSHGLNILSGETGAGKSIFIDSLMLLFGARYDRGLLRYGAKNGLVEGVFDLNENAKAQMLEMGFDDDDVAIISRRLMTDGKSEIRVNGRTATASMLKQLMSNLIDIYGQHDYQNYTDKGSQLRVMDHYVRQNTPSAPEIFSKIAESYKNYKNITAQLSDLGDIDEREKNIDFLKYQIKEIEDAKTYEGEEDELVARRHIALNSATIMDLLSEGSENLQKNQLRQSAQCLQKLENYGMDVSQLGERLESAIIEIDDIAQTLADMRDSRDGDGDNLDKIEDRLTKVRGVKRKFGDYNAMVKFLQDAKIRLQTLENSDELYAKLVAQKEREVSRLYDLSLSLSKIRKEQALVLSKKLEGELHQLGMENALFEIKFSDFPSVENAEEFFSSIGTDSVEFYATANPGQPLKPFAKTASGGEMSRFMLALKAVIGDTDKIPTLIFDEIDAGISGKVGQEVAKKLARIAKNRQVLCVTHLPQIASMGDTHFYVSKECVGDESQKGTTLTNISTLTHDGMIKEISRLCGSIDISDKSEANARQMKDWSDNYKKTI